MLKSDHPRQTGLNCLTCYVCVKVREEEKTAESK
jgi:hypothetical protein